MSKRILAVPAGNDGCSWYRMRVPYDELNRRGSFGVRWSHEFLDHQRGTSTLTSGELMSFDAVIFQRPGKREVLRLIQDINSAPPYAKRPKVIIELDDNMWAIRHSNEAAYDFWIKQDRISILDQCLRLADGVTVSTLPLAEVVRETTPATVVVAPNSLPEWTLPPIAKPTVPTILWAGTASHVDDLTEVSSALNKVFSVHPKVRLRMIGADLRGSLTHRVALRTDVLDWFDNPQELYANLVGDVAIAPLQDTTFNASKSDVKLLEYTRAGLPTVVSAVGPYRGSGAVECRTATQFARSVLTLLGGESYRHEAHGRVWQNTRFRTIADVAPKWESKLEYLISR